jgi:DNA invertase Pin-like site-specific DNA recombinase
MDVLQGVVGPGFQQQLAKGVCYGYCRVSTQGQADQGISIPAQKAGVYRFYETILKPEGYTWGGYFIDPAVSTKVALRERPDGAKLLAILRPGDAIVCLRSDRMFRSLTEASITIEGLLQRRVSLFLTSNGMRVVADDPGSKMIFSLMAVVDQFDREITSHRTREALWEKRMRGEPLRKNRPPLGFTIRDGVIVPDNNERVVMQKIASYRSQGLTYPRIVELLKLYDIRRSHRKTLWTHGEVSRAPREERRLQEIQQLIQTKQLDPMLIPFQYRNMHDLPACQQLGMLQGNLQGKLQGQHGQVSRLQQTG